MSKRTLLACALAGFGLAAGSSAQRSGAQLTNLGERAAPVFTGHSLTGKAAAEEQLARARAASADQAFREAAPRDPDLGLHVTNMGDLRRLVFEGHKLSVSADGGAGLRVLYAPSEADDPFYRADISTIIGGGTICDYFDARVATPSLATLLQYDAVYTWASFAYADRVLFGNNLAAFNDQGGTVILGVFCSYTSGNSLAGAIMTQAYCPVVSPLGDNHFSLSTYSGDGTTCIYWDSVPLKSTARDVLVTQGTGVSDGSYADGEICHAYRGTSGPGQGDVIYSNGGGASQLPGTFDEKAWWDHPVGHSCLCPLSGVKVLYAPSAEDDPAYRAAIAATLGGGATVDYFDARFATPGAAMLATYDVVHTWANFAYADNVLFGDRLAQAVDTGVDVVLGAFCTFTSGHFLSGAIMTPAYSPVVSPSGTNHLTGDADAGPFFTCVTEGVALVGSVCRDRLTVQGEGIIDSRFDGDQEIAVAYRPTPQFAVGKVGHIVYANGSGGAPLFPSGLYSDWPRIIANAASCFVYVESIGVSSCTSIPGTLGNPDATACGFPPPHVGDVWKVTVNTHPLVGTATLTTFVIVGFGGPTTGTTYFGYELLVLPPFASHQVVGDAEAHFIAIPPVAGLIGEELYWQGVRVEENPVTVLTVILTNGLKTIIGG